MIIHGLREIAGKMIPFCIDSEHITAFMPDDNPNEAWIEVYLDGQHVNLGEESYIFINGVKVSLADNLTKVAEYLQTIMMLERKDPPLELQEKIEELVKKKKTK